MASMPARQTPPSRRASRPEEQPQSPRQNQSPVRSPSEESQTIFMHENDEQSEQQPEQEQTEHAPPQMPPPPSPYNPADDQSIKKCWICFSDETEDTLETTVWRDPCPCALVAHEECLLDWIADMEAPTKRDRGAGLAAPQIKCPQCKSEITLARPRDYIVDAVRVVERVGSKLILPASGTALFAALHSISASVGLHSIYAIFGADHGSRILRPFLVRTIRPPVETYVGNPSEASEQILRLLLDHAVHWRLYLGLPLITPILILSRTSYADSILPVLPIVFFASQAHVSSDTLDFGHWPPSASFSFAVLPYVRAIYNTYYQKVWAEKEKRWLQEIRPRGSQDQAEGNGDAAGNAQQGQPGAADQPQEGDNVFEIRVDQGLWDQWDAEEERLVQEAADRNPPAQQQPPQPVPDQAEPPPDIQDNRPQPIAADAEQQNQAGLERRLSFSPTGIAETVIGALLFPTIAGIAGEALKLVLPTSWTTPPAQSALGPPSHSVALRKAGFLQSKWARSLVGGCLFVVCKDALMLYVRWRMAQMHRRRRVVDVDRKKLEAEKAKARGSVA